MKQRKILKRAALCLVGALVLLAAALTIYLADYRHADEIAVQAMADTDMVSISKWEDNTLIFAPETDADVALIYYPGGKVEYTAYAPLMQAFAERGILCVLVKVPANLAILDINAADGIRERFPDIDTWYVGGHSLGGAAAAQYIRDHSDAFDGLLLTASYSNVDLSDLDIRALAIYGENDGVLDMQKLDQYRAALPADAEEAVIAGGCHALFGSYGPQPGDGTPTISGEEQIRQTADLFRAYLDENPVRN